MTSLGATAERSLVAQVGHLIHGTRDGYNNHKCRCDNCRHAGTVYQQDYSRERAEALGPCSVPGCERGQHARGLCAAHYERQRRTGDVGGAHIKESSVRDGELGCMGCQEWLPDSCFPFNRSEPHRRGRHKQCRVCLTEIKREWRERNKVPCSHGCGTLVDGKNRRDNTKPPECRSCAQKRVTAARAAA